MTFYNHIENVRTMAINLTNGEPWHGARDKARVFDSLDAARREYMRLSDENAKLRELVSDFDKCLTEAARLAYIQGHMTIYDGTLLDSLHPRMRELGVEVD